MYMKLMNVKKNGKMKVYINISLAVLSGVISLPIGIASGLFH